MELWTLWLNAIRLLLETLNSEVGLGLGLSIVLATLLLRTALLPISWSMAYRTSIGQKKMQRLQPEIQQIREQFAQQPLEYHRQVLALCRKHDITQFDGKSFLGIVIQMPIFLGMYQVLRSIGNGVRFLWVSNLIKPDLLLAVFAGITTAMMFMANPDLPEQTRTLMILIPSIIAVMSALHFCSALALYWIASNGFSMAQTLVLRSVVERRIRQGTLNI